jgi:hypothetical protein
MTARHGPGHGTGSATPAVAANAAPPTNRAERRGHGRKAATGGGGFGKVRGTKFDGPAPRQYQVRKHG